MPPASTELIASPRKPFQLSSPIWRRSGLWALPLAFLGYFFFVPLFRIFSLALGKLSAGFGQVGTVFDVLGFTLYQAALSTLLTFAIGLPAAYLFARYNFWGKSVLRALIAVPFLLPTVVVAAGFNALLGPRGMFASLFGLTNFPFMGTLSAILIAHIFYNTTIVVRIVGNALASFDRRLEMAAIALGADPQQVVRHVWLPLLWPSILAAGLLVFLFDFTSFGVILLLGASKFSTLEVEIYSQAVRQLNLPLAALLALIQLVCTLIVSILYSYVTRRYVRPLAPRSAQSNLRRPTTLSEKFFVGGLATALFVFFVFPLVALPFRSVVRLEADRGQRGQLQTGLTADYYEELFINRRGSVFYVPPIQAALNSLLYAGATVGLSLLLGFPAALALARPTRLETVLDPLIMLPLGSSAVMLGLGFLLTFGRWLSSPLLVPVAHTLVALPFVIRALQPAIAAIPERMHQAAAVLGASPRQVRQAIDLPLLRRAILAAGIFAFTVSLGEFGATLLIARPEYPTIPVAIQRFLSQPGGLNYGQAMAMASILLVLATVSILLIEKLRLPNVGEF